MPLDAVQESARMVAEQGMLTMAGGILMLFVCGILGGVLYSATRRAKSDEADRAAAREEHKRMVDKLLGNGKPGEDGLLGRVAEGLDDVRGQVAHVRGELTRQAAATEGLRDTVAGLPCVATQTGPPTCAGGDRRGRRVGDALAAVGGETDA